MLGAMHHALLVAFGLSLTLGGCAGELAAEDREPEGAQAAAVVQPDAAAQEVTPREPDEVPDNQGHTDEPPPHVNPPPNANPAPNGPASPPPENVVFDKRWAEGATKVAAGYSRWGRVDDEFRWAPALCRLPRPATARISGSSDEATHGRKLYTLYAMDPVAYGAPASMMIGEEQDLGIEGFSQVIVKEAFAPVPLAEAPSRLDRLQPAEHEGKRYAAGEPKGLYLMMKIAGKKTKGTDEGWVYGTVAADGKTLTSLGVIDSCAGCHRQAGPSRLFGMKGVEKLGAQPAGRRNKEIPQ